MTFLFLVVFIVVTSLMSVVLLTLSVRMIWGFFTDKISNVDTSMCCFNTVWLKAIKNLKIPAFWLIT